MKKLLLNTRAVFDDSVATERDMKAFLDWPSYQDAGMGDAYADIPKTGGNFAKAVAVCIKSGLCERAIARV